MAGFTPTVFTEAQKRRAIFTALNVTHTHTDLWLYFFQQPELCFGPGQTARRNMKSKSTKAEYKHIFTNV